MSIQTLPGIQTGRTVTPKQVLQQAAKDKAITVGIVLDGTNSYDGDHTSYEKYIRGGAVLAFNTSTSLWAPLKRSFATAAGSASTSLVVNNATHFRAADSIIIGTNAAVAISSIDYTTDTITIASAKTWLDNDEVYVAAWSQARAILLDDEVSLWNHDKSANVNASAQAVLWGYVNQDQVLGDIQAALEDPTNQIANRILFDDYIVSTETKPDAGPFQWRKRMLQGNVTLVAADSGVEFYANAAATITLPAIASAGKTFRIRAHQTADANLTIVAPSGKMIAINNAAATSVAYSTANEKIGAGVEISLLPDETLYIASNISAGANTVTVA